MQKVKTVTKDNSVILAAREIAKKRCLSPVDLGLEKGGAKKSEKELENRLEEIDVVMNEAKAIVSFLDEATYCFSGETSSFIDDIHSETGYGLHLCFLAALERIEKAKDMLCPDKAPER